MTREQATIRSWDAERGGSAVRDDGSEVVLAAGVLSHSILRLLRPGQRVALVREDGDVTRVDLV